MITGITGQDGSYLAEFLLQKGYQVHASNAGVFAQHPAHRPPLSGPFRRRPEFHPLSRGYDGREQFDAHSSKGAAGRGLQLAAQSHVAVSFEEPEYTADSDGIGRSGFLRRYGFSDSGKKTRFYQASTSELYGKVQDLHKRIDAFLSPVALRCRKTLQLLDHGQLSRGLRTLCLQRHLFNHESPRRGETLSAARLR